MKADIHITAQMDEIGSCDQEESLSQSGLHPPTKLRYRLYTMFVNRNDVLVKSLDSLGKFKAETVILDNATVGALSLDRFLGEIVRPCTPLYCNQSYNLIQEMAEERDQDVFFIMHSDALASEEVVQEMLDRAVELNKEGRRWGVMFSNYDVLALMNTNALRGIHWDQYIPLYYTDCDYYYRLKLAGIKLIETGLHVEHQEGGSTTQSDPELKRYIETNWHSWRNYYLAKWGGDRSQEKYLAPFNEPMKHGTPMVGPTLSVIIPTHDGQDLDRCLISIQQQELIEGDEIFILGDTESGRLPHVESYVKSLGPPFRYVEYAAGYHAWGHPQLNHGISHAKGDFLVFIDDDDAFQANAFWTIRRILSEQSPPKPHMFKFIAFDRRVLWDRLAIVEGSIGGHQFVTPNIPGKVGQWSDRYNGDFDFITSTLDLWPADSVVWREEIISVARPDR